MPYARWLPLVLCLAACGTARPQSPELEPTPPERGVVPDAPPADLDPSAPAPTQPELTPAPPPLTPELAMVEVNDACLAGPMSRCADAVAQALTFDQPLEARSALSIHQGRIATWQVVDVNAIGVLLPLSGPYANIGNAAKEAIDLALKDAPHLRVLVRDTAGDADQAAAAATDLILREHVAVLLGPIGRKESAATAKIARLYEVPLVPLTSELAPLTSPIDPGLPPEVAAPPILLPDAVVRVRTSPSELVTAVARHARLELGVQRAAMLVPDTELGREAALAFRTELERLGATVVREVVFDPNAKDLSDTMKTLVAFDSLPPKKRKQSKVKPDFDALFVPGDAMLIRKLLPSLTSWGIKPRKVPGDKSRVQLIGTSGWNQPTLIDKGGYLTDNAVFADVFAPDDPDAQDFGRRFFLHLQRRPTTFHAETWDATRLTLDALANTPRDATTRVTVLATFRGPRMLVGATGTVEVLPGGRVQPRTHLMTVDGEVIRRRLSEDEERALRTTTTPPENPR